jgi:hypothetical protein
MGFTGFAHFVRSPVSPGVSPLGDQILISYKIAFTQYHYGDPQIRMKAIAIHIAPINTTHSRDSPSNANLR